MSDVSYSTMTTKSIGSIVHLLPTRQWGGKFGLLFKYLKLMYIKRCDAYNNASFGTDLNAGAQFKTPPRLPHGPNGIIVSPYAKVGANAYIYH